MTHPQLIRRQKLLEAAVRVFAASGFRGATTRRIAEAAGVNEVTLFRHFKSKTALILEAARFHAWRRHETALPAVPSNPLRELTVWCHAQLAFLHGSRALIRKCLAELEEHPAMAVCMRHGSEHARIQLREYAGRLARAQGSTMSARDLDTACAMLVGALFADAMGRDMMPDAYPQPRSRAPAAYARLFLGAIGLAPQGSVRDKARPRTAERRGRSRRKTT